MARRRKRVKPAKKISKKMKKKLLIVFVIVVIVLIALVIRLMYIEHTSGEKYEKIVLSQQEYNSVTIPYQRGDITDTKGTILATSVDVYNVILDCKVLLSDKQDVDTTVAALVQCFPELDETTIRGIIAEKPEGQYNVLAKKLPYEEIKAFEDMEAAEEADKNRKSSDPQINGVWFEKEYQRQYPYNSLASAVIGFTTSGNVGMNGIENYYNSTLNGINGREYGYLNSDSNFEKTIKEATNGENIVTTIDVNIQSIVESKIAEFQETYKNGFTEGDGAKNVGVIVMNPQNGEVLAMANYPNYDLNNPWDLSAYYTQEEITAMTDEETLDALNHLWTNYCITNTYEPGSTVKPFTVAAGLESGALSGAETYVCDGLENIGGHDIHCVSTAGHGTETIQQAIMNSCNDALMQMSYAIGPTTFAKYQKIFGFGQKTNIDLPGEARTDTLIYSEADLTPINLATNAFGQNFNANMIQVASAFSSLVNGGNYYQPHVVRKITDEDGNTVQDLSDTLLKQTVSKETSDIVKEYLYQTVSNGTAKTAKVDGYSMGGKTGTAQTLPRGNGKYVVSFIGYAPQDNPQLLVYVVVDQPNVAEQAHSTYAQEISRKIFAEALPYLNIYQDEELTGINSPDPATTPTDGTTDVPDVVPEDDQTAQDNNFTTPIEPTDIPADTPAE